MWLLSLFLADGLTQNTSSLLPLYYQLHILITFFLSASHFMCVVCNIYFSVYDIQNIYIYIYISKYKAITHMMPHIIPC